MQLFYAPDLTPQLTHYTLPEEESKHCIRVLRMVVGDRFHITDGVGNLYCVEIESADVRRCRVAIREVQHDYEQLNYSVQIAVAPTKNMDRLEWFVEKATEIGVERITPLLTDRCERRMVKRDRLEKVAVSAMKQSLKATLPQVDELTPFEQYIRELEAELKIIAYCEVDSRKLLLRDALKKGASTAIIIGPEGDFSPEEITFALAHGFVPVSLGRSRLRTETAALVSVHTVALLNEEI